MRREEIRRKERWENGDIKVSSRRDTERRNQMTLKAAFNYEDIYNISI